jgi:hypothetical protein
VPHFRRPNVNRAASLAWTHENTDDFNAPRDRAAEAMFAKHVAARRSRDTSSLAYSVISAAADTFNWLLKPLLGLMSCAQHHGSSSSARFIG